MTHSGCWQQRLFCVFFIGKRSSDKSLIPERKFNKIVGELRRGLKAALGGSTTVRSLEQRGDTLLWGPEPTRLILNEMAPAHKNRAELKCRAVPATDLLENLREIQWIPRPEA